jgi:dephospho-CoA kinase
VTSGLGLVIAVIGLAGSGKSSAVEFLAERMQAPVVYFGGVVIEEVQRRGLELSETNERMVRESLRREFGMGAIAMTALPAIEHALSANQVVILDGLYSSAEVEVLDRHLPCPLVTVAVHTARRIRESRMANRKHRPLSAEELLSRDRSEIRLLDKAEPIAMADIHILNDADRPELHRELHEKVLDQRTALATYRAGFH